MAGVMLPQVPTRRFSVQEVLQMVEQGILAEREPLELLDGTLIVVPPQGPGHAHLVRSLAHRLGRAYDGVGVVSPQCPLHASDFSLPEPDLAVLRGDFDRYRDRHPRGSDCLLVVEISFSTERIDRHKGEVYAAAGVPVYWNLLPEQGLIRELTRPRAGRYESVHDRRRGDQVSAPILERRWSVVGLLGDPEAG